MLLLVIHFSDFSIVFNFSCAFMDLKVDYSLFSKTAKFFSSRVAFIQEGGKHFQAGIIFPESISFPLEGN